MGPMHITDITAHCSDAAPRQRSCHGCRCAGVVFGCVADGPPQLALRRGSRRCRGATLAVSLAPAARSPWSLPHCRRPSQRMPSTPAALAPAAPPAAAAPIAAPPVAVAAAAVPVAAGVAAAPAAPVSAAASLDSLRARLQARNFWRWPGGATRMFSVNLLTCEGRESGSGERRE